MGVLLFGAAWHGPCAHSCRDRLGMDLRPPVRAHTRTHDRTKDRTHACPHAHTTFVGRALCSRSKSAQGWTLPPEVIEFAAVLLPPIPASTSAPGPTSPPTSTDSHVADELQARAVRRARAPSNDPSTVPVRKLTAVSRGEGSAVAADRAADTKPNTLGILRAAHEHQPGE